MKKRKANWFKVCTILFLAIYASYILIKQEIEMNKYDKEKTFYLEQIELASRKHEEYKHYSEYVKTEEYIEKVAREKLGMLLPEERVYIEYSS